jgi:hypothetical protein
MFNSYAGDASANYKEGKAGVVGTNYKRIYNKRVSVANGNELQIAGRFDYGIMTGCLHVPDITRNLISVRQLTKDGYSLTFSEDKVLLHHPNFLTAIQIGTLNNNLYVATTDLNRVMKVPTSAEANLGEAMDVFTSQNWDPKPQFGSDNNSSKCYAFAPTDLTNINQADTFNDLTVDLLHRRFGHVDPNKIIQLLRREAVDGLQISRDKLRPMHYCEHCIIAKATQHSMSKDKSTAILPSKRVRRINRDKFFEIVHTDLIGPLQVESINGMRYGITFTEVNSRYRWFYPLRSKNDALDALKSFHAEITSQGFNIKILKSDNGGEFTSHAYKSYCTQVGITQRFTQPHTPQSNSFAERFNRVLGERSRAMLYCGRLPLYLWDETMETVTHIYNRMIGPGHPSKTPFELLYGYKPDCSHLRAYGCLAFAYNFDVTRQKLDPKALKGTIVGYDKQSSAYRIYIPSKHKVMRSGHVIFNEHRTYYDETENTNAKDPLKLLADSDFNEKDIPTTKISPNAVSTNSFQPPVLDRVTQIRTNGDATSSRKSSRTVVPVTRMHIGHDWKEVHPATSEDYAYCHFMDNARAFNVEELIEQTVYEDDSFSQFIQITLLPLICKHCEVRIVYNGKMPLIVKLTPSIKWIPLSL